MKKYMIMLILAWCIKPANAQTDASVQIATKIADRMKDSLELSASQRESVYAINMQLAAQKDAARQASTDRKLVGRQLQRIENTRDSLFRPVLGEEKYLLYKQKKKGLINNQ